MRLFFDAWYRLDTVSLARLLLQVRDLVGVTEALAAGHTAEGGRLLIVRVAAAAGADESIEHCGVALGSPLL